MSSGKSGVRASGSSPSSRLAARRPDPAGALFESIPHAVVILGRDGHVIHANSAAEHLLKTALRDLRGRPLPLGIEVPLDRALHGTRFHVRRADGAALVVRADTEPALAADGSVYQVVCTLTDVSDEVRAESEFRSMFEQAALGMLRLELDGTVADANAAACAFLGFSRQELTGRDVETLLHPEDGSSIGVLDLTAFELGSVQAELRIQRKQDEPTWVRAVTSVVPDAGGGPAFLLCTLEDISRRKSREAELEHQVLHDVLTGLPNRILLQDRLRQAIRLGRRQNLPFALFLLDLDCFKEVNDTLGHASGDVLLSQVANRLARELRASDTMARLGGDEFAVILPGIDSAAGAEQAAGKLLKALNQTFEVNGEMLHVGGSIGVVLFPEHGRDNDTLLRRADVAMYAAKRAGGGFSFYTLEQDDNSAGRLALIADLRQAIDQGQLLLHYQPKVDLQTGAVLGVEALVRWQHPEHGLLTPDRFLPLAEHTGLIEPLGRWVLEEAIRQAGAWKEQGMATKVAVNLSVRSLHDQGLPDLLADLLQRYGVEPALLQVEITESTLMADPELATKISGRLAEMGVQLAIDDFGTGYSSLAYVRRLQAREIKIDKSFVLEMARAKNDAVIVQSTIDLGRNLGLRVVAEGVEDQATWDLLLESGCEVAQGFMVSRPLPAEQVLDHLRASAQPGSATVPEAARRPAFSFDEVNRRLHALEPVALFSGVPEAELRRLARLMTVHSLSAGGEIVGPQRGRDSLWVIEAGSCEILVEEAPGREVPLAHLGAGDLLDPDSLDPEVLGGVRVLALTDTRLLALDRAALGRVLAPDSALPDDLARAAAERLASLSSIAERARAGARAGATMMAVYSPKGGSGKSTIALNLAALLAREHADDVLLFDLSLPYNHAALLAKVTPTTCLARIAHAPADSFDMLLRGAIVRHSSGFMVLSSALRPEEADLMTPELVLRALQALGAMFTHVVFDLGVGLSDSVLSVLEMSHHVIAVATPELTSMKDMAQVLGILADVLRLPAGRVHVVLNNPMGRSAMTLTDVERVLERQVAVQLPHEGLKLEKAALAGDVLPVREPNGPTARATALLAQRLVRHIEQDSAPGGIPAFAFNPVLST
ncbi:MAG TPA: EAL domain-containing protein [Candidatus Dormibacteraeota bacterium]